MNDEDANEFDLQHEEDKRPDPKPRKNPHLWQSYLWWNELVEMRKRHDLRIASIDAGKSNLDVEFEYKVKEKMNLDNLIEDAKKEMIGYGRDILDVWEWVTSIKGLKAGSLAAQLLAQIDDISLAPTVSALWRYCGQAVIDGKAERNVKGEKSHFNRRLKSICWLISEQFIRQQTKLYVDIYYVEKERQRLLHPEKIKVDGKWKYNDGHLHNMAKRKMVKIFLQHLWLKWRKYEGLPVSNPYVIDIMGHSKYIEPGE